MKNLPTKILIVDDEPDIIEILKYNLNNEGYDVKSAYNGKKAVEKAKKFIPDIILLDVMMPEMDGIEACVELKKISSLSNTRIIFLSARGEDFTQIAAFDAGADDYVTKPVKPKILIKKISSISKRIYNNTLSDILDLGEIKIDKESYLISINKEDISLPRKEFELLYLLASKPGKVFSRDEIMHKVWGSQVIVGDRTIDVHIRKLREKIGEQHIKTIKGVGYKFKIDVKKK
ncbi:MAG: response regulator transcription factor [Flavobacteriaceae bacterium]|nr:response regulator transcription factor [Flavobacteriaceae bacterium]MBL6684314.1 response regulator transcription factor [Flavobacteriaceae bacterium]